MPRPSLRLALLLLLAVSSSAFAQEDPVVLITGFKPWGTRTHNPSWEGAKLLQGEMIEGYLVKALEIDVDYRKVARDVPKFLGEVPQPAVAIHFGVAGSNTLRLERKAHNQASWYRDDGGYSPVDNRVAEDGPMIYTSELPEAEILEGMNAAKDRIKTSDNAGSYLCEYTFYTGLYHREKLSQRSSAGFIHVPYFRKKITKRSKRVVFSEDADEERKLLAADMRELIAIVLRKRKADAAALAAGQIPAPPLVDVSDEADASPEAVAEGQAAGADSKPFDPSQTNDASKTDAEGSGEPRTGIAQTLSKKELRQERRRKKREERRKKREESRR